MNLPIPPAKHRFFLRVIVLLLIQPLAGTQALEVTGKPVPDEDIQLLPPVCKLILVEMPGIHLGNGGPYSKFEYVLNKPEYQMAKNNPYLHHYCWALVNKTRYFRANNDIDRNFWFSRIMDDTDFVLQRMSKDWPYTHIILLEQGLMMMMQGDYSGSLSKAKAALEHKPDDQRAYAMEFDDYTEMKDKKMAIKVAEEGLKKIPSSKMLRKRLEQLGIKAQTSSNADDAHQTQSGTPSSDASLKKHK